ncbi:hypothetical protein RchiOBHm_Chr1g0366441 [Rosa chinensis]|uniref:Uncharacterized protein n=1 Tax=Rosa chinensis TaxID=74649 RepID=A0A2P6SK94_ROSCH|nr:hypothetical protein RchiOBHm_Chr1g0366441 [Rosa chinensis]
MKVTFRILCHFTYNQGVFQDSLYSPITWYFFQFSKQAIHNKASPIPTK